MDVKTVLITGGSRGIGKAIALRFAAENYNIALCGRDRDKLREVEEELSQFDISLFIDTCDVRNREDIDRFFKASVSELGQLDVLVNNAGVFIPGKIQDEDDDTFLLTMETNINASYYFSKLAIPHLKKSEKGHIFNICSVASITPYINGGSYCISKYAQYGMSKVLREELKEDGVRVTAVLPGATLTNSWSGTELPESRFINVSSIAESVYHCYALPKTAVMEEIIVRPMLGDID